MDQETSTLEFKEQLTNSFLKTVSAYANYRGGTVLFGVDDNGRTVGLSNPKQACLDIENKINDSIYPQPNYRRRRRTPFFKYGDIRRIGTSR